MLVRSKGLSRRGNGNKDLYKHHKPHPVGRTEAWYGVVYLVSSIDGVVAVPLLAAVAKFLWV